MSKPLLAKLENSLDSGELLELVDNSFSNIEVLRKLGYSGKGQYCGIIREFLLANDVDISHFRQGGTPPKPIITKTCPVCCKIFTRNWAERDQVTCGYSCSNTYFRSGKNNPNWKDGKRYRERALSHYGSVCIRCGYNESLLAIDVHHVDRNRDNNELDNLEVLCCNCHAIEHRSKDEKIDG